MSLIRPSHQRRLGWEAALLAVPVVALVGFGFLALGWEKRAEREELRMRCQALVEPLREDLLVELEAEDVLGTGNLRTRWDELELPLPGGENELTEKFSAGEFGAVLGEASSFSEAGLPLRPLAALRLLREETDPHRLEELVRIMRAERSLVTPRLLEEAEERFDELGLEVPGILAGWEEQLVMEAKVREVLTTEGEPLLSPTQDFRWVGSGDNLWLAIRDLRSDRELLIPEEAVARSVSRVVGTIDSSLPAGVGAKILLQAPSDRTPALLEASGVPPIKFAVTSPTELRMASSGRRLMFTSFLILAGVLAVVGIGLLLRTVLRERELAERKGNLVAAVSHEMRTPVASIRLLAENLCSGAVTKKAAREKHLRRLVEQSERLSTLVENVLSYSRRAAGKAEREDSVIEVEDLMGKVEENFRELMESKGVGLRIDNEEIAPAPRGDRGAILEALLNLVDNALKFSPERGVVCCGAAAAGEDEWVIWVEDEGPGVKKEERTKIFEAFYRVGAELRRETTGTGLGLALVQQVADLHGGSVRCLEGHRSGARFELRLPRNPNP